MCKDVTTILNIPAAEHFAASINRPNLHYEVQHKTAGGDEAEQLSGWIIDHYPDPAAQGIVYCLSR